LHAVVISSTYAANGQTVGQLKKEFFPAHIRSFTRRGIRSGQEPQSDVVLQEGDILMIEGSRYEVSLSEDRIIYGKPVTSTETDL